MRRRAWGLGLLAVVALFSSCTMWKNPPKAWQGATGGEQLERQYWSEIKAGNWTELDHHLAPMFVYVTPSETREKPAALDYLKKIHLDSYQLSDIQVQSAGIDAVVTATVTLNGTIDGRPLPSTIRTLTVWQPLKRGWVAIAHSNQLP